MANSAVSNLTPNGPQLANTANSTRLEQPFVQHPGLAGARKRKDVARRQRALGDDVFPRLEVPEVVGIGQRQRQHQHHEQCHEGQPGLGERMWQR